MCDPFNLQRFLDAQHDVYANVQYELSIGRKTSHWMWFIFPQIQGLGSSAMAQRYAIKSLEEASAYVNHRVLGARLLHVTNLVMLIEGRSIDEIVGFPDNRKFQSSMTLFAQAAPDPAVFIAALDKYFNGAVDAATLDILNGL